VKGGSVGSVKQERAMNSQIKKGIVIAAAIIVIFSIILLSVNRNVPPQPIEKTVSPLPKERVIAVFGEESGNTEMRKQDISISELINKIRPAIQPYLYPDGPVIGYSRDINNSIVVMIYENWTLNQTTINEIHDCIAAKGIEYGVDPVQCRFIWEGMPIPDYSADAQPTPLPGSGKPCKSNEEWHVKADQIGFWSGGILVDESMKNQEIFSMLRSHNISNPEEVKISVPHHIGYYLSVNQTQDKFQVDSIKSSENIWNVSFSSPMYAFLSPEMKNHGDRKEIPVFLLSSEKFNETMVVDNLLARGVPLRKTKIVRLGYFQSLDAASKVGVLQDLNGDHEVLFAFKEYLEGDIC
jgi:hypothetical protein